jgi:hypothetical protein
MATQNGGIVCLDPTSGPLERRDSRTFRSRPPTLSGAVVGLVINGIGRSDAMMDALYEELANEVELAGKVRVVKGSVSVPPEKPDWERLTKEATVAITGFGG